MSTITDVAVGCIDDIEVAALVDPFLTVVVQPTYEMDSKAMELLPRRMNGFAGPPSTHLLPTELIVRRSSLAIAQA